MLAEGQRAEKQCVTLMKVVELNELKVRSFIYVNYIERVSGKK